MKTSIAEYTFSIPAIMLGLLLCLSLPVKAEELGRLFTTKQERTMLERIRQEEPEPVVAEPVVLPEPEPEVVEEEKPEVGVIKIKGLVRRKNGTNTAWINDGNTYEGNYTSDYITVPENDISSNQVPVEIPYNQTMIRLKVGQTYVPAEDSVQDVVDIAGE